MKGYMEGYSAWIGLREMPEDLDARLTEAGLKSQGKVPFGDLDFDYEGFEAGKVSIVFYAGDTGLDYKQMYGAEGVVALVTVRGDDNEGIGPAKDLAQTLVDAYNGTILTLDNKGLKTK